MTQHFNKKELKPRRRQLRREMTFCEKVMWIHLRKKGMNIRFLRQYSVDSYVIDFYSPEIKLAVELDGDVHELSEQKHYDIIRQEYLESFGITVLRITNDELMENSNKAFEKLKAKIEELKKNRS